MVKTKFFILSKALCEKCASEIFMELVKFLLADVFMPQNITLIYLRTSEIFMELVKFLLTDVFMPQNDTF